MFIGAAYPYFLFRVILDSTRKTLITGGGLTQKDSGDISGLEATANESARPYGPVAADCPGPNGWRSGGGVDGAEISVNATAQPCRRAISRRPETPFRTYACLAQR